MKEQLIIVGGGEHAKVIIDSLQGQGRDVIAVIDSKYDSGALLGAPRYKNYVESDFSNAKAIVAIGDNKSRKKMAGTVKHAFGNSIDTSSIVSSRSVIGKGCMILHRAIVQISAQIGDHVILNTGAQVDHDCVIGDYVHIAPRAVLCGTVKVGEGTLIGAGATVLPGITIGKWCIIAAGTVVTRDVTDYSLIAGVPGVVKKTLPHH